MLETFIRKAYALIIFHNLINRYLMNRGLARAEASKRKQQKWVLYGPDTISHRSELKIT